MSLKTEILNRFDEELNGELFRMYYFEKEATDVSQRKPIDIEETLVTCVQRIFEVDDIELFVFNVPTTVEGKRPSHVKLPCSKLTIGLEAKRIEGSEEELGSVGSGGHNSSLRSSNSNNSGNSTASPVRRNILMSDRLKKVEGCTCKFCGYQGTTTNIEVAHIVEINEFNQCMDETELLEFLLSVGLDDWDSFANMLCLCSNCHQKYFDRGLILINPENYTLEISETIHHIASTGGAPFLDLRGKKVETLLPLCKLALQHRYKRLCTPKESSIPDLDKLSIKK